MFSGKLERSDFLSASFRCTLLPSSLICSFKIIVHCQLMCALPQCKNIFIYYSVTVLHTNTTFRGYAAVLNYTRTFKLAAFKCTLSIQDWLSISISLSFRCDVIIIAHFMQPLRTMQLTKDLRLMALN